MQAWECACLPKKFIHKEHVKLLLQTDPLELRKEFDSIFNYIVASARVQIIKERPLTAQKMLWTLVKFLKFANQIIENHKIVNFKDVAEDYKQIVNGQISNDEEIIQIFEDRLREPLALFKKYTDGMLKASKIKKMLEKLEADKKK